MLKLLKIFLPPFISYILLQLAFIVLGWIMMNGFSDPKDWIPISKWPDWYMVLLSMPAYYIIIKVYIDNKIANKEL